MFIFGQNKDKLVSRMHETRNARLRLSDLEKQEFDSVSIGTRPTGTLHVGNLSVLMTAMKYLKINSKARIYLDIMDLDFDLKRGSVFTPFVNLPTTKDFISQARLAVEIIATQMKVDPNSVEISFFSDKLAQPALATLMNSILTDREIRKAVKFALLGHQGSPYQTPISLICSGCGQSSTEFARYITAKNLFASTCNNKNCSTTDYEVPLIGNVYNVFYTLDPVRDLLYPGKTVHIFGGDYDQTYGALGMEKYARIGAMVETVRETLQISSRSPSYLVTPLLTDPSGNKISKSSGNFPQVKDGNHFAYLTEQIANVRRFFESRLQEATSALEVFAT